MATSLVLDRLRLRSLSSRDPHEEHRQATPLELLYDLTLVVAFGTAGNELAHAIAYDHIGTGIFAFAFIMFAAVWAWINHTLFAAAYDNDDWFVRLSVLAQMVGVLIMALGIPQFFAGIEEEWQFRLGLLAAGYIVMRVPLIFLWLRVANDHPEGRRAALTRVAMLIVSQLGWTALALAPSQGLGVLLFIALFIAVEISIPIIADRHRRLDWHAHHLTERFGLLAIIAFGEGIIGTFVVIQAIVTEFGFSVDAMVVLFSGVTLTFGMWWVYFMIPSGELLHARRSRIFRFGLGHIPVYMSIAGMGAGLHTAAYYVQNESKIGPLGTVLSVVIPTAIFIVLIYLAWHFVYSAPAVVRLEPLLLGATLLLLVLPVVLAGQGVPLSWCLGIAALSPWVSVVGYELWGRSTMNAYIDGLDPIQEG